MSEANTASPLTPRKIDKPIWIEVRYRGGPQGSFDVRFRGRTKRFAGSDQLIDVMLYINGHLGRE